MSISIKVGGMNYNQLSCEQRADMNKKRKSRLVQVRQQSKEIAQQVRVKVQCEKKNQLKKIQEIKDRELTDWKRRTQSQIQQEYGHCFTKFGAAHIAACDASCEEDEASQNKRKEYDLLAAERGRCSMLQEQRKRDREAEERLAKRKRRNQKNAAVQVDPVTRKHFGANFRAEVEVEELSEDENDEARVETFSSKPNLHKSSASAYNAKNFTSHSVDSSNNNDSGDEVSSQELESDVEFNQITNLLKHRLIRSPKKIEEPDPIEISESSESDDPIPLPKVKSKARPKISPKKGILKKVQLPKKKTKSPQAEPQKVKYVDYGNKYTTSYVPKDDLVTTSRPSSSNARAEATKHMEACSHKISDDVLRQLSEIRSKEALEKERTRRDYERLRSELDEISKKQQEAKDAAGKALRNITATQLTRQEQIRQTRMNLAVENTLKRNIITCPPVDPRDERKATKPKSSDVNVAAPHDRQDSSSDSIEFVEPMKKPQAANAEVSNIVKVERLKDLLERINHQKKLLLREIEKNDDIPGRDLDNVMKCLEKLEREKAALDAEPADKKKISELQERESKLKEREKRFEDGVKELYKAQKEFVGAKATMQVESDTSSEVEVVNVPPVEIIIKVHPKSPRVKVRKSFRCIDTLSREPGKVYRKTPKKAIKKHEFRDDADKRPEAKKVQQETQTTPSLCEVPKTILKKPQEPQPKASSSVWPTLSHKSDDSSISTMYQALPEKINEGPVSNVDSSRKPHHKLNPLLMHYITRLLGMGKNIGNQLSVSASTVTTPGSSTINTSENNESESEGQPASFDQQRLDKFYEFITNNYSFLNEVNESIERSELRDETEDSISKVDGIWRDVLRKKKTQSAVVPKPPPPVTKTQSNPQQKSVPQKSAPAQKTVQASSSQARPKTVTQSTNRNPPPSQPSQINMRAPPVNLQPTQRPLLQSSSSQRPQTSSTQRPPTSSIQRPQTTSTQRPQTTAIERPKTASIQRQRTASSQQSQITNQDMLNVTKYLESHMLNNFTEYTANCQKRIEDLAQMMNRVRQEKLKLIENSLSSGEFAHFTEYREIAVPGNAQEVPTSASELNKSPSQREDPPSEEINNILQKQTRPFGVSKDSGISMLSRPVTSSDFRDSPDVRVTSEERENTFQPILKDIPKAPKIKLTTAEGTSIDALAFAREQEEKAQRKLKPPPLSLNRFSPNLEKPHEAHELSTIAEVETPSASKVNLLEPLDENAMAGIESFPNFEQYANMVQASLQKSGENASFPRLGDLKNILEDMQLNSFLGSRDHGIQEALHLSESRSSSAPSSFGDIVEELKRRQIIENNFQEGNADIDEITTPSAAQQPIADPVSPRKKQAQSRFAVKTPEKVDILAQTTPTKKKQAAAHIPVAESPKSSDTLSGIQEIEREPKDDFEKELEGMGLNWAKSMFTRDNKSKQLESSSSSSSAGREVSVEVKITTNESTVCDQSLSSSSGGKPLNLREFLSRELKKRERTDKSLSDESSLSSQFMRSLLNASSGRSSVRSSDNERVRTSTPVQLKVNTSAQKSNQTQLFTSLSTVKNSDESSGKSKDENEEKANSNKENEENVFRP